MWLGKLALGIILIAIGVGFWYSLSGNSIDDLRLFFFSKSAKGKILRAWEEISKGDRDQLHLVYGIEYEFAVPSGEKILAKTLEAPAWMKEHYQQIAYPYSAEIDYLPDNPQISRIAGDIGDSVLTWFWNEMGVGVMFLFAFLLPGVVLIKLAFLDVKNSV